MIWGKACAAAPCGVAMAPRHLVESCSWENGLIMPDLEFETLAGDPVMGIDEAGRGPLAGPVFAAAVSMPLELAEEAMRCGWRSVNDSKKLTPALRASLAKAIASSPECLTAVASASPAEIDRLNILRATHLAMGRAAKALAGKAEGKGAFTILVDGLAVPTLPFPSRNIVGGDAKSLFIAAASILAKTARDAYCVEMDARFPGYGFARHKGYPTPQHLEALRRLGPCPEHRRSFAPVREQWLL